MRLGFGHHHTETRGCLRAGQTIPRAVGPIDLVGRRPRSAGRGASGWPQSAPRSFVARQDEAPPSPRDPRLCAASMDAFSRSSAMRFIAIQALLRRPPVTSEERTYYHRAQRRCLQEDRPVRWRKFTAQYAEARWRLHDPQLVRIRMCQSAAAYCTSAVTSPGLPAFYHFLNSAFAAFELLVRDPSPQRMQW
jgi:hypothetical protein